MKLKKVLNPTLDINEQENKEKQIYEQKKLEKTQKKTENRQRIIKRKKIILKMI